MFLFIFGLVLVLEQADPGGPGHVVQHAAHPAHALGVAAGPALRIVTEVSMCELVSVYDICHLAGGAVHRRGVRAAHQLALPAQWAHGCDCV